MNRIPSFPHDWILPREFRYCSCGMVLLPEGKTLCATCKYRPTLADALCRFGETDEERKECEDTHIRLAAERDRIAESRRAASMAPLFWMSPLDAIRPGTVFQDGGRRYLRINDESSLDLDSFRLVVLAADREVEKLGRLDYRIDGAFAF